MRALGVVRWNTSSPSGPTFTKPSMTVSGSPLKWRSSFRRGLTLVHFSTHRKHFLWDTLGTFSRWVGHELDTRRLADHNGLG